MRVCAALRVGLLGYGLGWGQDAVPAKSFPAPAASGEQGPVGTLKVSTRIVVLDVVVTDRKGSLVDGLGRDDFTIVEDNVPQTLRSFEGTGAHRMPAGVEVQSAADLSRIGDAPVTVLVLDELNTRFEDMATVRGVMVKFLEAQPAVLRQPTVLLAATDTRFLQMHDYTQNRDELVAAVKHRMPAIPTKRMAGKNGGAGVERMAQSLASLEQIAQASSGTPGRKNVIWMGNGFPSSNSVGLDETTAATIRSAVKQCTDMLLAARITMYTINPTPNSTVTIDYQTVDDLNSAETESGGDPYAGGVQFSTFAPATGGRAFTSRNDIGNEIGEGIAQGANPYTLSYAPTNKADMDQKYRVVRVVMKDPNLRATTRHGYYPPTAATGNVAATEGPKQAKAQLTLDISSAVKSAISYNGLEVQAVKAEGGYSISVKGAGMQWRAVDGKTEQTEATVIAAWYDGKGKLLGHAGKELTAQRGVAAPGEKASFTLPVSGVGREAQRVRIVVRDAANGRMGTVDLRP